MSEDKDCEEAGTTPPTVRGPDLLVLLHAQLSHPLSRLDPALSGTAAWRVAPNPSLHAGRA